MIKAIIFDYIGVLVYGFEKFYPQLARVSARSEQEVKESFSKHWQLLKIGKISDEEFWKRMKKDLDISQKDASDMKSFVINLLKTNKKTLKNLENFSKKYSLYLLSNSCYGWSEVSFKLNGLGKYFKETFFSHNIGMAKPDKKLYEYVLNKIKINSSEILFADDSLKNIAVAKEIGFKTIHFHNWDQFLKDFNSKFK